MFRGGDVRAAAELLQEWEDRPGRPRQLHQGHQEEHQLERRGCCNSCCFQGENKVMVITWREGCRWVGGSKVKMLRLWIASRSQRCGTESMQQGTWLEAERFNQTRRWMTRWKRWAVPQYQLSLWNCQNSRSKPVELCISRYQSLYNGQFLWIQSRGVGIKE